MLDQGTRRFDLYDFFSVFIPGAALLLGLFPFLPAESDVFGLGFVLLLVIGGFVVGRAIHAVAIKIEKVMTSHRDRFVSELKQPDILSEDTVDSFYTVCKELFDDIGIQESREDAKDSEDVDENEVFRTLYGLVRSYIHMDGRGRSRTFQAVFAFYRSIWIVSAILAVVYLVYGFAVSSGAIFGIANYTSFIGSLEISPTIIIFGAYFLFTGAYITFREVLSKYRDYFVQYLISDFLVLQKTSKSQD